MIQENELVMLVFGVGVLAFILANRSQLKRLPSARFLLAAFYILLAGWILTVLEGYMLQASFNFMEHLCYAVSAIALAIWCRNVFASSRSSQ